MNRYEFWTCSGMSPRRKKNTGTWSRSVTRNSDALDLENHVFAQQDPAAIARSLKRSAVRSHRRKTTPFRSAMSMLNFYINRAGDNLPASQRNILEEAKEKLRELFHKNT